MTDTLELIREDIPDIDRSSASGREAIKWEDLLKTVREAPANEDGSRPGFRVWTYDANDASNTEATDELSAEEAARKKNKTAAASRVAQVNRRLRQAVPQEKWFLASRPIEKGSIVYGVYARFDGTYTKAELDKMAADKATREADAAAKKAEAEAASNAVADEAPAKLANAAKKAK